jgi:short-subunit dehydrogenase
MLAKQFKNIVLVGANSDIGLAIIHELPLAENAKLHLIGSTEPDKYKLDNIKISSQFRYCDLENLPNVKGIFNEPANFHDTDLVILAAGYLPPENLELNLDSIEKTMTVNALATILLVSGFMKLMSDGRKGQILVLSSVASIRPRIRNFTYGASKSALDFYSIGIQNKFKQSNVKVSVARPGFVFTKMTSNFSPAPFAINLEKGAQILAKGLLKEKRIIYAPRKLKMIMGIVRYVPRRIFNKLG